MTAEELEERGLDLTSLQLKAAKKVYAAMRAAGKLGVEFWDNYGTLTCINADKVTIPYPESGSNKRDSGTYSVNDYDPTYYENLKNFYAGNSDDELFYDLK